MWALRCNTKFVTKSASRPSYVRVVSRSSSASASSAQPNNSVLATIANYHYPTKMSSNSIPPAGSPEPSSAHYAHSQNTRVFSTVAGGEGDSNVDADEDGNNN